MRVPMWRPLDIWGLVEDDDGSRKIHCRLGRRAGGLRKVDVESRGFIGDERERACRGRSQPLTRRHARLAVTRSRPLPTRRRHRHADWVCMCSRSLMIIDHVLYS